jgi:hypothetical protein
MHTNDAYQINTFLGIVQHHPANVPVVRDSVDQVWWEQERKFQIAMQVRSGDYFATLATKLDTLSQDVKEKDDAASYDLELLVADLLYLQRNYNITKKQP